MLMTNSQPSRIHNSMNLIDIDTNYSSKLPSIHMPYTPSNHEANSSGGDHDHDSLHLKNFPNLSESYGASASSVQAANVLSSYNPSDDANKAYDNVVFDILKVDPEDIAGQLTLIDLPLFKQIEPDELISCKWISRDKLTKAPNIVQFTRRFNQTTFWCQSEILNCKRIETRGKMITNFIKMAKRLNELHSFNSLMAIIVALKAQPIYRLRKTWSQYVNKRDVAQFERLADLMFDTNDNKRKIRDMHMNCRLPCIPFLGLFLTDLIHIDIAHPHNSFDNPQRRNQMNNICRLISEYQQSNYQDLTSLSCDCQFTDLAAATVPAADDHCDTKCIVSNCSCPLHHGSHVNGSGLINNDGTIYINEIGYIRNYLNSFLYIEELQRFKEEENYRDSLQLEPEASITTNDSNKSTKIPLHVSPSSPSKLSANYSINPSHDFTKTPGFTPLSEVSNSNALGRSKSASIATNMFNNKQNGVSIVTETTEMLSDLKLTQNKVASSLPNDTTLSSQRSVTAAANDLIADIPLTIQQQKQLLAAVKINDPSSLLRELLKQRHNNTISSTSNKTANSHTNNSSSFKNKFNCYSSNTADLDDDTDDEQHDEPDEDPISNSLSLDGEQIPSYSEQQDTTTNSTPIKLFKITLPVTKLLNSTLKSDNDSALECRRLSGRNLITSLNEPGTDIVDSPIKAGAAAVYKATRSNSMRTANTTSKNSSSSDLFNALPNISGSVHNDDASSCHTNDLSSITHLSNILALEQRMGLVLFESPVKRKCIIKNSRKPRFSHWKSYWLQLVAGNILIYYPAKSIMFNHVNNGTSRQHYDSEQSSYIDDLLSLQTEQTEHNADIHQLHQEMQQQEKKERLQSQLQPKKVCFNKNPSKMHSIANWMVVNSFQDQENEILAAAQQLQQQQQQQNQSNSSTTKLHLPHHTKFDIQLNDLNNGNMYKYRFDNLQLAKEWYEQFKLASTYHEREKPDNLIRFD